MVPFLGLLFAVFVIRGMLPWIIVWGTIMLLDSFGFEIPSWVSPVTTFGVVGYFFWRSRKLLVKLAQG